MVIIMTYKTNPKKTKSLENRQFSANIADQTPKASPEPSALKGKQTSYLRKLANNLRPVFQIGKEGLTDQLLLKILSYLKKHELGKISLLKTSPQEPAELVEALMAQGIIVIQIIGKTLVLYKANPELKTRIELPL